MVSAIVPLLASAIMISTPQATPAPQASTSASIALLYNRVGPENSLVDYLSKEGMLHAGDASKPKKQESQSEQPLPIPTQSTQTQIYPTQSSYDDTYKAAGTRFGVPWQILYGIHMTETGCRNGAIFSGYGSGAQGPMQFMPGTWKAYGVDGDGDGIADINNAVDAINGAANYLAKHGSLENGLRSYGGNISGTLAYARAKGFTQ